MLKGKCKKKIFKIPKCNYANKIMLCYILCTHFKAISSHGHEKDVFNSM